MRAALEKRAVGLCLLISCSLPVVAVELPKVLPDPDGKPADMTKPVQVFILMGQFANYSGMGSEIYQTVYRWIGFLPGGSV